MSKKFYITTAIDYPNGKPHLGHAYEKICTDSYARWHRFMGEETYFLTGTDENGQKLQESAKELSIDTQEFVDKNVEIFKTLCKELNISNDDFIRTTEERHAKVCTDLWNQLNDKKAIYFDKYSGNYCLSCENFYTETQAPDGNCPHHHIPLELKEEDGYFFKMSEHHDWIVDYIKSNPNFIVPRRAHKEILSRLEQEAIRDVAFSRPNNGWGIPVPGDDKFVMYTWADALVNYYSAIIAEGKEDLWPADVHVIGKDIVWFHCVIWPCMLHAAGIELPKQVYVHGMVLAEDGKKMSKSLGNVVDPAEVLEKFPLDTFRYYILRGIPAQDDGTFSMKDVAQKHNSELGNDYGNLIMRVIKLSLKHLDPKIVGTDVKGELDFSETYQKMKEHMDAREHNKAMDALWTCVNAANQYVNDKEPWKLKTDHAALSPVIYNCCYGIHQLALLLSPFLPDTATKTLEWLGVESSSFEELKFGEVQYNLTTPLALFNKVEIEG